MNRALRHGLLGLAVMLAAASGLSCGVNDYCISCARPDDGGGPPEDAQDGGGDDATDGGDAGPCVPTGLEVCDGEDNDCNGQVDDGTLPTIGEACTAAPAINSGMGECAGGVKQCTAGAIVCSKPAVPELCDTKDNNCNGLTDEGDPGGGALCGTNQGECTAGVNRCVSGTITCTGAVGPAAGGETCNNRDDDCDGNFDEGITGLGSCVAGADGPAEGDTGECVLGTRACMGGVVVCQGAVFPAFEQCDASGLDQDCNGQPSNGYNLNTDPQNCGACGMVCNLDNSFEGCAGGACTIVACAAGYHNNNGLLSDGCEFGPCAITGNEACDGLDNDCDGLIDTADPDLLAPIGLCDTDGACATGTTLSCAPASGGWTCAYTNPNVQTDAMGNIVPETRCDSDIVAGSQADNDCDGQIDEGQPTLSDACGNGLLGVCQSQGTNVCDTTNRVGPAVCQITQVGGTVGSERCDGLDNNCDGVVDDGAATGNLPDQDWITIPGLSPAVQMMKYEASRPDALTANALETHACAAAGRQPWTNVTYPQAAAACSAIGARLCTETEWQQTCMPPATFPAAGPATAAVSDFTFIEAEDAFANTTIGAATRAWTRVSPTSFNGITAMQVPDNNFSVPSATNALAQSSRLDYQLTLLNATTYNVWLRVRSPAGSAVSTTPRGTTPATAITAQVAPTATAIGDLVLISTWTTSTSGIPTHTAQSGFTEIRSQTYDDGNNDGRLSVSYTTATVAGAQAYTPYAVTGGTGTITYSTITVYPAGAIDTASIVSAPTSSTSNNQPDPPDAGNLASNGVVFAVAAWHLSASANVGVSPPANYSELGELVGSATGELSTAVRVRNSGDTGNPGSFADDTGSVNGTASMTVILPFATRRSNAVWTGLTAGTVAGAADAGNVSTTIDDRWQWVVSPAFTTTAAGTHTFSLYTRLDGLYVDTIAVSRQGTTSPTFDDAWAYATNPRTAQPQTCNVDDYDTDAVAAGDQDGILPAGALASCYAEQGANDAYDMTGNVKEWTAARAAGQNPLRGGASNNEVPGSSCQINFTLANDAFFFPNVGFRCCR